MPTARRNLNRSLRRRAPARGAIVRKDRGRCCAASLGKCRSQHNLKRRSCTRLGIISKDPIGFAAGDANLYRYVGNQPTSRVDPSGLSWIDKIAKGIDGGWLILKSGKTLRLSYSQFAGKDVTLKMLKDAGSTVKEATLKCVKEKFWDNVAVHYDEFAQPDFGPFAEYVASGLKLTGNHPDDVRKFLEELKKQLSPEEYKNLVDNLSDFRLHHHSDDTMMVVDKNLHIAFPHTGSSSILRKLGSLGFVIVSPGLYEIDKCIKEDPNNALEITDEEVIGTAVIDVLRWFDPFLEAHWNYLMKYGVPQSPKY